MSFFSFSSFWRSTVSFLLHHSATVQYRWFPTSSVIIITLCLNKQRKELCDPHTTPSLPPSSRSHCRALFIYSLSLCVCREYRFCVYTPGRVVITTPYTPAFCMLSSEEPAECFFCSRRSFWLSQKPQTPLQRQRIRRDSVQRRCVVIANLFTSVPRYHIVLEARFVCSWSGW